MTPREVLHELVDKLPESELVTAVRILKALEEPANRMEALLVNAPEDDEPFDAHELDDTAAPFVAHADVIRDRQKD